MDTLKLSPEQLQKYIESGGSICPFCLDTNGDLSGGSVEIDNGHAYQDLTCGACGQTWTDEYNLVDVLATNTD